MRDSIVIYVYDSIEKKSKTYYYGFLKRFRRIDTDKYANKYSKTYDCNNCKWELHNTWSFGRIHCSLTTKYEKKTLHRTQKPRYPITASAGVHVVDCKHLGEI